MKGLFNYFLGIIFCGLLSLPLVLQAEEVGDIRKRLVSVEGKERIPVLHELSEALLLQRDSSAIVHDAEALRIAREIGGANLLANCLNHRAHSLIELSRYEEAMLYLNEAETYFSRAITDREKAITYWRYGNAHHKAADYNLAEFYMNKSLELVRGLQESALEANIAADLELQVSGRL